MRIKHWVLFLVLFACFAIQANQTLLAQNVIISKEVKLTNKLPKFRIIGKLSNKYLVDRYNGYKHVIDVYSNNMSLLQSKDLNLHNNQWVERIWLHPDKGFLVLSEGHKGYSKIIAKKMDSKVNFSDKVILLDSIPEKHDVVVRNFRTKLSLNETKLATYYPFFESNKFKGFKVSVYNASLGLLQTQTIKDASLEEADLLTFDVFNDGSFLMVFSTETGNKEIYSAFKMVYADIADKTVVEREYSPKEDIFKKPKFEIDEINKKLFIAGFYVAPKLKKSDKDGAYRLFSESIDIASGESNLYTETGFDEDFILDLTGRIAEQEEDNVLYTFYVNRIVPKHDGGCIVFTESYYKDEENDVTSNSGFNMPGITNYITVQVYHFNDIIAYDISSDGSIVNREIIRKKQVSENDSGAYGSFFLMNEQDQLRLLFLDEIFIQGNLREYVYAEPNEDRASTVFNMGEKDVFPVVKLAVQPALNEVIVPSFNKNNISLIKIVYPL